MFISQQTYIEYKQRASDYDQDLGSENAFEFVVLDALEMLFHQRISDDLKSFWDKWKLRNPGIAVLDAHGYRDKTVWCFHDGKRKKLIQSWVDLVDAKFGTLILLVCDESIDFNLPKTESSLLFIPDGVVTSRRDLGDMSERHHFSLFHPTYGEICDYTVSHAEKSLIAS